MDKGGAKKKPEPKINNFGSATLEWNLSFNYLSESGRQPGSRSSAFPVLLLLLMSSLFTVGQEMVAKLLSCKVIYVRFTPIFYTLTTCLSQGQDPTKPRRRKLQTNKVSLVYFKILIFANFIKLNKLFKCFFMYHVPVLVPISATWLVTSYNKILLQNMSRFLAHGQLILQGSKNLATMSWIKIVDSIVTVYKFRYAS